MKCARKVGKANDRLSHLPESPYERLGMKSNILHSNYNMQPHYLIIYKSKGVIRFCHNAFFIEG